MVNSSLPLRVIYKKNNMFPEIKIINNSFKLKQAILSNRLLITAYKPSIFICNLKNIYTSPNVVFTLKNITGDFIVIKVDYETKNLKSISQEEIFDIISDLSKKSFKNNYSNFYREKTLYSSSSNKNNNFETQLINVLTSIELTLATLLKNNLGGNNQ